ncbi:ABC transporter ATP-binding protein [Alteromonas sp. a30]|uniref:ABC transporter ATP-binding protein n=1 Tax=Alteromonas sp. a30 TaxID=2730917 RepID=UPI002282B2AB|nr:ABC transporter ATP-binding protein [Alteromonas sp. a30]MCY7296711.1 ABC transporter ATP-binding protein [Alteromonas sp. a30]
MIFQSVNALLEGFRQFYRYNPKELVKIFCLMLTQKVTSGIGLLLILPLLQVMGLTTSNSQEPISQYIVKFTGTLGIEVNFFSVVSIFLGLMLLVSLIDYVVEVNGAALRHFYTHTLRTQLYRQVLYSQWQFLSDRRLSEINHTLALQVKSMGNATNLMLVCLASSISLVVLISLSFFISWSMTLFTIVTGLAFIALLWPYFRRSHHSGAAELSSYRQIFNGLSDQLRFLKTIKSHQYEERFLGDIRNSSEKLEKQSVMAVTLLSRTKWVYKMGAAVVFVTVLTVSQIWLHIPIEQLIVLLLIYSRLLPQLSMLNSAAQQLTRMVPVYSDIQRLQAECLAVQEPPETGKCIRFEDAISLKHIGFTYPNAEVPVLSNMNLTLKRGQTLLIRGKSGIGKSTLVDIISGLLPATEGQLFCDNTLITSKNMRQWRGSISYVAQETYLLNDTLYRNLNPKHESMDESDIWQALELACASDFVRALPQQLHTTIGEHGVSLSGGEKQRIALARAFLMRSQLMVLDEATSALDRQTENKVHESLARLRGQQTMVIISHRPNEKVLADMVLELD